MTDILIKKPMIREIKLKKQRVSHSSNEKPTTVFFATKFFQGTNRVFNSAFTEKKYGKKMNRFTTASKKLLNVDLQKSTKFCRIV
jgi:hypothetical protein